DDPRVPRVTELRGEQHQHGAEPLAARGDQVPGRVGQQLVVGVGGLDECCLDPDQIIENLRLEGGIRQIYGNCDHKLSTSSARANASNFRVCPLSAAKTN